MNRIFIVAGERSGDFHGAKLAIALRKLRPKIRLSGVGSQYMYGAGVEVIWDVTQYASTGLTEALRVAPAVLRVYHQVKRHLKRQRPEAVVLIDYPEFNLKLASFAKSLGLKVIYYILPQVWAWRRYRVNVLKKSTDLRIVIFPFEEEFYARSGLEVEFVGHPLVEELLPYRDRKRAREELGAREELVVGLLPGSRWNEVERHLEPLAEAVRILRERYPDARFPVGCAPGIDPDEVARVSEFFEPLSRKTYWIMGGSDLVLTASGTATMETAIVGTPMVVFYRLSPLSWALAKALVSTDYVSMPNLVAGSRVVPELLQNEVTGERLAEEATKIIELGVEEARASFDPIRRMFGEPGAVERASSLIIGSLER